MADNTIITRNERLKLYGVHIGAVDRDLVIRWQQLNKVINFNECLKDCIYEAFGVRLINGEAVKEFQEGLKKYFYKNIGEWFEEYMRNEVLDKKGLKDKKLWFAESKKECCGTCCIWVEGKEKEGFCPLLSSMTKSDSCFENCGWVPKMRKLGEHGGEKSI